MAPQGSHALDVPGVGEGPCDKELRDAPMAERLR
jgi:hypothetical protein